MLANPYGDEFTKNLAKVVSAKLKLELLRIFADVIKYNFYYICADKFYLVVRDLPLEEARKNAERIRRRLQDNYEVGILLPMNPEIKSVGPDSKQLLPLTVHIGVSFYAFNKLEELLKRYSTENAIGKVRSFIVRDVETSLEKGRIEKGNVVMSWNPSARTYIRWSP